MFGYDWCQVMKWVADEDCFELITREGSSSKNRETNASLQAIGWKDEPLKHYIESRSTVHIYNSIELDRTQSAIVDQGRRVPET